MYQIHLRNALILQLIASILYCLLSLTFARPTLAQTYLFDVGFGLAAFGVSSLLAFWGFRVYR